MRKLLLSAFTLLCAASAMAQNDDPVIMTINGQQITRSEFEYSYNKNNTDGVIDKKSISEYVDLFINYKLKVIAAEEAKMDTLESFKKDFVQYRDMQIRPAIINDDDVEAEAKRIYDETKHRIDSMGGLVKPAHILIMARQDATQQEIDAAKQKIDSIYAVLKASNFDEAIFGELAQKHSQDPGSAQQNGLLPWIQKNQTMPEFDEKIFTMNVGETTEPVKTAYGYHIIQLREKTMFFPYETQREDIIRFIDQRGLREKLIDKKLNQMAAAQGPDVTPEMVLAQKREQMAAADPEVRNLIREYHDGLLLWEIGNVKVWEKASKDEAGLAKYFKKHKKDYKWDEPRFKGIAFWTRDEADVEAVKASIKKVKYADWNEVLRSTFNNDSVLRIRVEKGVFKAGDNTLVDSLEFHKEVKRLKTIRNYPHIGTYGKIIKAPEDYNDVKGDVITDYQNQLEKEWVAELRKKYMSTVVVNKEVLETVNKH